MMFCMDGGKTTEFVSMRSVRHLLGCCTGGLWIRYAVQGLSLPVKVAVQAVAACALMHLALSGAHPCTSSHHRFYTDYTCRHDKTLSH